MKGPQKKHTKTHSIKILFSKISLTFACAATAAAPALAQSLPSDYRIRARTVQAGVEQRLWTSWAIDADCEVVRGFNVRVSREPAKGEVSLRKIERTVDATFLNAENIRPGQARNARKCLGRTVLTIGVFYTARAGTSGTDSLGLTITNARQTRQRVVDLNIRIR